MITLFCFVDYSCSMDGKKKPSGYACRKKAKEKSEKLLNIVKKSAKIDNYFKTTDISGDSAIKQFTLTFITYFIILNI